MWPATGCEIGIVPVPATGPLPDFPSYGAFRLFPGPAVDSRSACLRESEINQEGKARKLWDIEEGKGI
ncbi:hypothetical protein DT384_26950 [Pseudomonas aeruginosa]|nr:hypothetical protein DT384_26950 [Pseudomonas aeruginosa]